MNKINRVGLFILIFCFISNCFLIEDARASNPLQNTINRHGKGFRYNIQGWVFLHIEGDPYERGYQYGYLASDEIIDMMNRWSSYGSTVKIMNVIKIKSAESFWNLCKSIALKNSLKEYPKEYQEEIQGIADAIKDKEGKIHGRAVEFEDILTLNEIQGCWYHLRYLHKMFHPVRDIFYNLRKMGSKISSDKEEGACSVFIATGDATSDGNIFAVHSTQPLYYLDQRFNFVIDVQPTEGNRFMMAGTPPGFIWSLVNFYQNEKGIILMESTLPQGPWKKQGIPIAVRSRKAIQYSNSIDDVLDNLMKGNNGLYECEWLIGDTKTGEIASIELALYNTPIKRTFNGFYWSCNYPHDPAVKREVSGGMPVFISNLANNIFDNSKNSRAEKFQEIEKQYYGKIDINTTKQIISTDPISHNSCDAKITSTKLSKDMGLILHMGNPNGEEWVPSEKQKQKFKEITSLPASGWVKIYPADYKTLQENEKFTTAHVNKNNVEYFGSWNGHLYAMDSITKNMKWKYKTGWGIVKPPAVKNDLVYFGSLDNNFYALNIEDGSLEWVYSCKSAIQSKPVVYGKYVFFGCDDGYFYALDKKTGEKAWSYTPGYYLKDDVYNYLTTAITSDPYIKDDAIYFNANDVAFSLDTKTTEYMPEYKEPKKVFETMSFPILAIILTILLCVTIIYDRKYKK